MAWNILGPAGNASDVIGPDESEDRSVVLFDGTDGKHIIDSVSHMDSDGRLVLGANVASIFDYAIDLTTRTDWAMSLPILADDDARDALNVGFGALIFNDESGGPEIFTGTWRTLAIGTPPVTIHSLASWDTGPQATELKATNSFMSGSGGLVIGATTDTPNSQVSFFLAQATKAAIFNQLTQTNRDDNITSPLSGMWIYNSDDETFNYYDGTAAEWRGVTSGPDIVTQINSVPSFVNDPGAIVDTPTYLDSATGFLTLGANTVPTDDVVLDLSNVLKALRLSLLDTDQRNVLDAKMGMEIFNTDSGRNEFFDGTNWIGFSTKPASVPEVNSVAFFADINGNVLQALDFFVDDTVLSYGTGAAQTFSPVINLRNDDSETAIWAINQNPNDFIAPSAKGQIAVDAANAEVWISDADPTVILSISATGTTAVALTSGLTPSMGDLVRVTGASVDAYNIQALVTGASPSSFTYTLLVSDPDPSGAALVFASSWVPMSIFGPSSSTDNAIVRWDGITGNFIQNSTATIGDDGVMQLEPLNTDEPFGINFFDDGLIFSIVVDKNATPVAILKSSEALDLWVTEFGILDENGTAQDFTWTPSTRRLLLGRDGPDQTSVLMIPNAGVLPTGAVFPEPDAAIHVRGDEQIRADFYLDSRSNTADEAPRVVMQRSRDDNDGLVADNDALGIWDFKGGDGVNGYITGASISAEVDGTAAESDMPTRIVFKTVTSGVSSTEKMRLSAVGFLGVGTTNPAGMLDIAGDMIFDEPNRLLTVGLGGGSGATAGTILINRTGTSHFTFPRTEHAFFTTGDSNSMPDIGVEMVTNNVESPTLSFYRSRTSDAAVELNDLLGDIAWNAWDGAQYRFSALFRCRVSPTGTVGSNQVPAQFEWFLRPDAAGGVRRYMTLTDEGQLGIGRDHDPASLLDVDGSIAVGRSDSTGNLNSNDEVILAKIGANSEILTASVNNGGSDYDVNDVLTVAGGTGTAATLTVTSVDNGVIDGISVTTGGDYSILPSLIANLVDDGNGNGATIDLTAAFIPSSTEIVILTVDIVDDRIFWVQDETGVASNLNPITVKGQTGLINGAASIKITEAFSGFWVRAFGGNLFVLEEGNTNAVDRIAARQPIRSKEVFRLEDLPAIVAGTPNKITLVDSITYLVKDFIDLPDDTVIRSGFENALFGVNIETTGITGNVDFPLIETNGINPVSIRNLEITNISVDPEAETLRIVQSVVTGIAQITECQFRVAPVRIVSGQGALFSRTFWRGGSSLIQGGGGGTGGATIALNNFCVFIDEGVAVPNGLLQFAENSVTNNVAILATGFVMQGVGTVGINAERNASVNVILLDAPVFTSVLNEHFGIKAENPDDYNRAIVPRLEFARQFSGSGELFLCAPEVSSTTDIAADFIFGVGITGTGDGQINPGGNMIVSDFGADKIYLINKLGGQSATGLVIVEGGMTYDSAQTLTVEGGEFNTPVIIDPTETIGSAVTQANIEDGGNYSVLPTNAVETSSDGPGVDATFNLTFAANTTPIQTIDSPLGNVRGVTWHKGNLYSCDSTGGAGGSFVFKHNGFSDDILETLDPVPPGNISGIVFVGANLVTSTQAGGLVSIFDGFSLNLLESFASPFTQTGGIAFDGINLIISDNDTTQVAVMKGVSNVVQYFFDTTAVDGRGIACIPGNGFLVADLGSDAVDIYDHPVTFDHSSRTWEVLESPDVTLSSDRGGSFFFDEDGILFTPTSGEFVDITNDFIRYARFEENEKNFLSDEINGALTWRGIRDRGRVIACSISFQQTTGGGPNIYQLIVSINDIIVRDSINEGVIEGNNSSTTLTTLEVSRDLVDGDTIKVQLKAINSGSNITVYAVRLAIT